jgi:hypothetical protein
MKNIILFTLLLVSFYGFTQRKYKNITEKDGKIGIGTNMPDELLTVKGKIHTQEVLVDLNGAVAPDFVFETFFTGKSTTNPTYKLPTLKELEVYLKENHHLPEIPSGKEITKNGLSLKQMNLLLLQKIEELTLYTLQQQKELDRLKEQVKLLEN